MISSININIGDNESVKAKLMTSAGDASFQSSESVITFRFLFRGKEVS